MTNATADVRQRTRAFVIGNGPSLLYTPMDALRDEFTIGLNRLHLLNLDWDPDWWIVADVGKYEDWDWEQLLDHDSQFIFREHDRPEIVPITGERDNMHFIPYCEHETGGLEVYEADDWHWHLPQPCFRGGGASLALQLAVTLGKNPIYLVGCDLYQYRGPGPDINHFDPHYTEYRLRKSTGEELVTREDWDRLNARLIRGHEMAKKSAALYNTAIYNAAVGGNLEVYPRVDIRQVLNGKTQTQEERQRVLEGGH